MVRGGRSSSTAPHCLNSSLSPPNKLWAIAENSDSGDSSGIIGALHALDDPRGTISPALPRAGIVGVPAHSASGMRAVALVGSLPRVAGSACALLLVDSPPQPLAERDERGPVSR